MYNFIMLRPGDFYGYDIALMYQPYEMKTTKQLHQFQI